MISVYYKQLRGKIFPHPNPVIFQKHLKQNVQYNLKNQNKSSLAFRNDIQVVLSGSLKSAISLSLIFAVHIHSAKYKFYKDLNMNLVFSPVACHGFFEVRSRFTVRPNSCPQQPTVSLTVIVHTSLDFCSFLPARGCQFQQLQIYNKFEFQRNN